MKNFFLILCLAPAAIHGQRLSYSITSKNQGPASIALVVSNIVPIEAVVPKLLVELRARDLSLALSKEQIDLSGISLGNSPFAPEILAVVKINVLNNSSVENALRMDVQYHDLATGARRGMMLTGSRDNTAYLAAELAKFIRPSVKTAEGPALVSAQGGEVRFSAAAFPGLRRGDEISLRLAEPRRGQAEVKLRVLKIETSTNGQGLFESLVTASDKSGLAREGDKILRIRPPRHRFSFSLMGTVAPSSGLSLQHGGQTYAGNQLWGGGFIIQGEYEKFLPYGLTSTTTFGLNVDGTINTFLMTGIGWRAQGSGWELIPSLRFGLAYVPLAFAGPATLQGSGIRFGMDVGLSFLYKFDTSFSMGFDLGLQYWFYSLGIIYEGSSQIQPSYPGGQLPLAPFYPRFGLKFAWTF